MFRMKHTIEIKLPKIFGKKKTGQDEPVVTTTIGKEDIEELMDDKVKEIALKSSELIEKIDTDKLKTIGVTLAIGFTAGYLKGNKDAIKRGAKQALNIVVIK
jgi:hypothetical protein